MTDPSVSALCAQVAKLPIPLNSNKPDTDKPGNQRTAVENAVVLNAQALQAACRAATPSKLPNTNPLSPGTIKDTARTRTGKPPTFKQQVDDLASRYLRAAQAKQDTAQNGTATGGGSSSPPDLGTGGRTDSPK